MKIYHLALFVPLAACLGQDWVDNPAEDVAVSPEGKADSIGQKLCGTANQLPANVCRTILDIHDGDWQHTVLRSSQGTEIKIDHKPHFLRYRDEWTAGSTYSEERASWSSDPVWFNVSSTAFTGSEQVRVAFAIKRYDGANCNIPEDCGFFQFDLSYAGDHRFSAQGNPLYVNQQVIRSDGSKSISTNAEEISVVVDGRWQDDPVSGSHNFRFNLARNLGF